MKYNSINIVELTCAIFILACAVFCSSWQMIHAAPADPRGNRAQPPKWPKSVQDVFFPDAREKLQGERPNYGTARSNVVHVTPTIPDTPVTAGDSPVSAEGGTKWSQMISAESIEDEIKTLQKLVSENVTTPAKFKGGGFKAGRRLFSELALLFAVIGQYDGEVRWKDVAPSIRESMARAGFNCKVGTDASYNESKLRRDDLEQLIQGGRPSLPSAEPNFTWDKVTNRPPLMQRLEEAQQQRIAAWTSNSSEFKANAEALLREAELVAAIGHAIGQDGFEFTDDDSYVEYAHQMRDAALEIVGAVKGKNYDAARTASGNIEKACTGCHEGYRS